MLIYTYLISKNSSRARILIFLPMTTSKSSFLNIQLGSISIIVFLSLSKAIIFKLKLSRILEFDIVFPSNLSVILIQ